MLKDMREAFEYSYNEGADNRRQRGIDMRFIAGDPWPEADKQIRSISGSERPCLVFDELNQYVNLVVNQQMQARTGIKVVPEGDGSDDKTAEMEANAIRGIEYRSKAHLAYTSGFTSATQGGFGGWMVAKDYVAGTWNQELCIKPIHNIETYIIDGTSIEIDGSDQKDSFIVNRMSRKEFEKKHKGARFVNFTPEHITMAPLWFGADDIQLATWWCKKMKRRKLLQIQQPNRIDANTMQMVEGPIGEGFADELKAAGVGIEGKQVYSMATRELLGTIVRDRWDEQPEVCSYLTNGIEILEETPWDGKWIPLIPCYGKILWVDFGSGPKRILQSLIRLARDPSMARNYCETSIVETIGQMPKGGVVGYEGQFENHEDEWNSSIKQPKAFLQVKAITEATGENVVLPLPTNRQFSADIAAAAAASENFRRAIQAAVGQNALPTSAQGQNEKSGIALQRIQEAQSIGSYHFTEHFHASLEMTGRILEDLLDKTYDTARTIGMRKEDGSYEMKPIDAGAFEARHGVTITTGPSSQSQREAAEKVAGDIMGNELFAPRVAWLAIKLLNLGPIGEQISDLIKPADIKGADGMNPQQIQAQVQQQQQQLQQAQAMMQELDKKLKEAEDELKAKKFAELTKIAIADKEDATKRWVAKLDADTKLALEAVKHKFKAEEIAQQGEIDEDLAETEHEQSLEAADQQHANATEQMETAADLAPEPKEDE